MSALMEMLRASGSKGASTDRHRKLSAQSVRIAQQCISRISVLVDRVEPEGLAGPEYLQRRLSQLSPVSPIHGLTEEGDDEDEDGLGLNSMDLALNSTDYLEAVEPTLRRTISAPIPIVDPASLRRPTTPAAVEIDTIPKIRISPAKPSVAMSLRNARKQFEQSQVKNFDPRKTEEVLAGIISRRKRQPTGILNDRISEFFQTVSGKIKDLQREIKERAEEEAWRTRLGGELQREDVFILEPIISLMAYPGNPISSLTQDFIKRQRDQLNRVVHDQSMLQTAVNEMHLYASHLVDLLEHNHRELALQMYELQLKLTIQHYMFTTPLASQYSAAYKRVNEEADTRLFAKCNEICWQNTLARLGIKEKFQYSHLFNAHGEYCLRDGEGLLADVVEEFKSIQLRPTPYLKLSCVSSVLDMICETINRLAQTPGRPLVEINIGSEDLLVLLAFVMVRGRVPHLMSEFHFIADLIPEEILKGESGYVLATFQTSIHYIEQI